MLKPPASGRAGVSADIMSTHKYADELRNLGSPAIDTRHYVIHVRKKYPRAYAPWSSQEEAILIGMHQDGASIAELSASLQRQASAIENRLMKLGLFEGANEAEYRRKISTTSADTEEDRKILAEQMVELGFEMDSTQEYIATVGSGAHCVVAGPGSGKTRTLVGRVVNLLHHGVPPEEIALVSHTRAAGHELKSRLGPRWGKRLGHIGTFHSLAGRLLRRLDRNTPRIGHETAFDAMLEQATVALKQDKSISTFKHLVIDEFQDTSDLQFEFLECLSDVAESIMVVGDPNQMIFEWAGVDAALFDRFCTVFPRAERHYLSLSYRCPDEILTYAQAYMAVPVNLTAFAPGGEVEEGSYVDLTEALLRTRVLLEHTTYAPHDTAVLVRYGYQRDEALACLDLPRSNVLTIHQAKGREWPFVIVLYDDQYAEPFSTEEQRILYVAATRASRRLVMLRRT